MASRGYAGHGAGHGTGRETGDRHTVKTVAQMAGVSVRTLHHYDAIGLLKPGESSPAGYRLYTEADLERLQQVMFFRELDVPLDEIRRIVENPAFDRHQALHDHHRLLGERKQRLERLMASVERTLESLERGTAMDTKELFDGFDQSQYEEEVKERWGNSQAYAESARRTKAYTKADWEEIKAEMKAIGDGQAALFAAGVPPTHPDAMALAARHRQHISDRFYNCPTSMYRNLAAMWVDDPRFAANYDKISPGLAVFVRDAALAHCDAADAAGTAADAAPPKS